MLTARVRTLSSYHVGENNGTRRRTGAFRSSNVVTAASSPAPANGDDNASTSSPPKKTKQAVTVAWVSADGRLRAEVAALAGDDLLAAATRAAEACGDEPPQAGCYSGSCGLCELTLVRKSSAEGGGGGLDGAPAVVRSCITVVPAGYDYVEMSPLPDDAIWGVDAWDT